MVLKKSKFLFIYKKVLKINDFLALITKLLTIDLKKF